MLPATARRPTLTPGSASRLAPGLSPLTSRRYPTEMTSRIVGDLEERLAAARRAGDPRAEIDAINALAWELRSSDVDRAHTLATEARERARDHDYTLGQARAMRTMAMTLQSVDELGQMFHMAEEARRLFDEAGDDAGRAASRDFLASLHEQIGDIGGGLELALDALTIARRIDDPVRQGYALSSVGGLLAASGETEKAVERLDEALALFEKAENPQGVATIRSRLAKALASAGRHEEALQRARECLEYGEANEQEWGRWFGWSVMAEVERERGNADEALRLYRTAISSFDQYSARAVITGQARVAVAKILAEQGKLGDADSELSDLLDDIAGNPVAIVTEAEAREALAELRRSRGDFASAFEHLRKAQELRERTTKREASARIAQVEARAAVEAARKNAEIHRLKYVELEAMQAQLVEAEKMALLGRLAAGTAHELNTPLAVLRNNESVTANVTDRLLALLPETGEAAEQGAKLRAALQACKRTNDEAMRRIGTVAESFRRLAHLDQAEKARFDIRAGLDSAVSVVESSLRPGVRVERRLQAVPEIVGWPRELNHAFLTVLENAASAIEGDGVVTVETLTSGDDVMVRIGDTGRGMTADQASKLFDVDWSESGNRTKMRLGLSAAHATTKRHGGSIAVESTPGKGTTLTFRLPVANEPRNLGSTP